MNSKILQEGYGPRAWHGPDLKAAVADVDDALAFWRPANGRHNIAEIALHHAFVVRNVRAQITGEPAEPFVVEGEDWFDAGALSWPAVRETLENQYAKLEPLVAGRSDKSDLILGLTCHAVYHAGQIQLIKRLRAD
jgi:hypothetical protein